MAIEFKAPLSESEEERVSKSIKEISSLMDKASAIMKSEIELLKEKEVKNLNMNQTILLLASYVSVQESLKAFMRTLVPVVK